MAIVGGGGSMLVRNAGSRRMKHIIYRYAKQRDHLPVSGKRKCLAPEPNGNSHYTMHLFELTVLTRNMNFGKTT